MNRLLTMLLAIFAIAFAMPAAADTVSHTTGDCSKNGTNCTEVEVDTSKPVKKPNDTVTVTTTRYNSGSGTQTKTEKKVPREQVKRKRTEHERGD